MSRLVILLLLIPFIFASQVAADTIENRTNTRTRIHLSFPVFELHRVRPSSADYLQQVKLEGSLFGSTAGSVNLYKHKGGQLVGTAPVVSWNDNEIIITVPNVPAPERYDVEIVKSTGTKSNRESLSVKHGQPQIDSLLPANAAPASLVVLEGSDLGSKGTLSVGGVNAQIKSWSSSKIKFFIPPSLSPNQDYSVSLVTKDGRNSSSKTYHVGS